MEGDAGALFWSIRALYRVTVEREERDIIRREGFQDDSGKKRRNNREEEGR